jgi:thiamine-monophosphate kinase
LDEEEILERYLRPLSAGSKGSLGLRDDVAYLPRRKGLSWVVSSDTMVEGVHYMSEMSPFDVGWRLLGAAFSDLAGSGAEARGYTLDVSLVPMTSTPSWWEGFSEGLGAFGEEYSVDLWGGDTTISRGNRMQVLGVSVFGEVEGKLGDEVPKGLVGRGGAREGDGLYMTGYVGEAYLGLKMLREKGARRLLHGPGRYGMIDRYERPEPRLAAGKILSGYAHAMMDISDGLLLDCERLLKTSGKGGCLWLDRIPLTKEAEMCCFRGVTTRLDLARGGDDYELLWSMSDLGEEELKELRDRLGLNMTKVGFVEEGEGLRVLEGGVELDNVGDKGYLHK